MDTKNIKKIQAEELIGLRSHLKSCLSKLDYKNSSHRQLAIEVMELYIKRYIIPAMHLPDTTIEGVIGNESLGFPLSVFFDSERKDLSRPSDEELTEALKMAVDEPTPQLREDFWTAWLVREAVGCLMKLCNFLEETFQFGQDTKISANVLRQEIEQLQEILELPMTGIKANIEILLE